TVEAASAFQALCEGLGNHELRGHTLPILAAGSEEAMWRSAVAALVRGFGWRPAQARASRRN
ncbi:MAG: hypothetical protein ACLGI7_02605, partial [Gammaproteobacteria bacterium]